MKKKAELRFYEELNDFLPLFRRKTSFAHSFKGNPSIKDVIESLGVPHTEVDLILANGKPVDFTYHLQDKDRVSVYPMFETLDISPLVRLRLNPLRKPKFILDVHLGKLAKKMRMLGLDTLFENSYDDPEIIAIAKEEKRAILTRDVGILKNSAVTHGYWVRSKNPQEQLKEVMERFDLSNSLQPFQRCMQCNHPVHPVEKKEILVRLLPKTRKYYDRFFLCPKCDKIYWQGSHYQKMKNMIEKNMKGELRVGSASGKQEKAS